MVLKEQQKTGNIYEPNPEELRVFFKNQFKHLEAQAREEDEQKRQKRNARRREIYKAKKTLQRQKRTRKSVF